MIWTDNTQDLLRARSLTRAVSEHLLGRLKDHLATLTPVFRPRNVLGDYVQGVKEGLKTTERALKELQEIYRTAAEGKPFYLTDELRPPLEGLSGALSVTPYSYVYQATSNDRAKSLTVTSPCRWILTYEGYEPHQLRQVLSKRDRTKADLHAFLAHYAVMQLVLSRQPGIGRLFEATRFPIKTEKLPEFGQLPFVFISSAAPTILPPDEVIIQSTEISGQNVFEEVVDVDEIAKISDPLREVLGKLTTVDRVQ